MPEEFKPGCQRPPIKKPNPETAPTTGLNVKEAKQAMVKVGKPAPDFTAPAFYNGKFMNISLSENKGKWVLLCFYPGDFTFVWATEISAVAEKHSELQSLGVEVLSVSVDSIYVHKMWNEHELSKMINKDIPFAMLSDQDGSIGKIYGIYDDDTGVETRGRFIIDPDGIIQGFEVLTPSVGRNVSESIRQINAFQLVRNSKGTEATPSGWKPGKPTLKPSPDLVGNIWKVWKVSQAFED
jgi:alkyl hydroperoxide reductase subunit AhpC